MVGLTDRFEGTSLVLDSLRLSKPCSSPVSLLLTLLPWLVTPFFTPKYEEELPAVFLVGCWGALILDSLPPVAAEFAR